MNFLCSILISFYDEYFFFFAFRQAPTATPLSAGFPRYGVASHSRTKNARAFTLLNCFFVISIVSLCLGCLTVNHTRRVNMMKLEKITSLQSFNLAYDEMDVNNIFFYVETQQRHNEIHFFACCFFVFSLCFTPTQIIAAQPTELTETRVCVFRVHTERERWENGKLHAISHRQVRCCAALFTYYYFNIEYLTRTPQSGHEMLMCSCFYGFFSLPFISTLAVVHSIFNIIEWIIWKLRFLRFHQSLCQTWQTQPQPLHAFDGELSHEDRKIVHVKGLNKRTHTFYDMKRMRDNF